MILLVDRNSASATEDFAAWVVDNERAELIGERTMGAGCGYISGGVAFEFDSLPIDVRIPNCSRYMRNGTNEIEGLLPDRIVDWSDMQNATLEQWLETLACEMCVNATE